MNVSSIAQSLIDAGFTDGWALADDELVIWEHDIEPPAPLTRPKATDETLTAD